MALVLWKGVKKREMRSRASPIQFDARSRNSINIQIYTTHQQAPHILFHYIHIHIQRSIMASQPANLADPVLLEKIADFFELGIGEYVALPQVSSTPL